MADRNDEFIALVLDEIEQREARLLTWGLADGYLSASELRVLIDQLFGDPEASRDVTFAAAADVIAALGAHALVFDVGETPGERYRSRMAETVRLLFRLRQLFPQHAGPTGWQTAPTLVADFRFIWRRRRYPRRNLDVAAALSALQGATADVVAQNAAAALLRSYGTDFSLAAFQVQAAARILGALEVRQSSATLVSAGTGSGKTLAFYIPALARIVSHIHRDGSEERWVKALALYPRNELLKDQFAEVYAQARRLDATAKRKILIGTFFGSTPYDSGEAETTTGWRAHAGGLICEYLRCPTRGCRGDMAWGDADRHANHERLVCTECGVAIESDEIILTRRRLEAESPDLLFTTTEMLNQRMGDSRYRRLFGLVEPGQRAAEMMLLDEVHTYTGASGAQAAYLLRRWRRMLRRPVCFVGLSATLRDGARFFANLTGVGEHASVEIAPGTSDLVSEGAEYLLALRGDPVSRTALLSTTIQSAMLLSRMLDAPDSRRSAGLFGERLFLFTDDIDVTNRMYFAMLDAEGRRSNGAIDMANHPQGGLAVLRRPMPSQHRKLHGQDWEAPLAVGHSLQSQDRKSVGRVMALDPGVDNGRDIIVATAALEVGFNDPRVGGVIQHKAPREVAQFLQRKGRAGRSRQMRPWTIAVLSDYGRDRLAYQGYDLLFDPELPLRTLPLGNRHIQRMQAVYATLDYLSLTLGEAPGGSVWTNLVGPPAKANPRQRQRQLRLADRIREILTSAGQQERFAAYLAEALRLDRSEVDLLLWEHPRPLLTQVLPTALRRLESNWATLTGADYQVRNSPLPEFAPANLFSDLNLPEVMISLPRGPGGARDPMVLPIGQAMREFAPGRVSRRYGLNNAFERHWVCPPLDLARSQAAPIAPAIDAEPLGVWQIQDGAGVAAPLPVLRPRTISVEQTPNNIADTSNARLRWRTQIVARQAGLVLEPPRSSAWADLIEDVRFHTHQGAGPIEARRMALGSDAEIRRRDGTSVLKTFVFENDGAPAALGFSIRADGLSLKLRYPADLWAGLVDPAAPLSRAMRTARFHDEARNGALLASVDNPFAREWLAHLLLATLSNEAMAKAISLDVAAANLAQGTADLDLGQTLTLLFDSPLVDDVNAQGNAQDRLRQDLAAHIADASVLQGLQDLARILWEIPDASWEPWLRKRFAATVGAAALGALQSLCPEVDSEGLVVDLDQGPPEPDERVATGPGSDVWITELAPGGNGHVEEALEQYAEDPRRFFSLMTAVLRDNDFSLSDYQLGRFLALVIEDEPDGAVAGAAQAFRAAEGAEAIHQAFSVLRQTLAEAGFVTSHTFLVALTNRILRPGSSTDSDAFLQGALRVWDQEEARLGVELDARVIAYRLARRDDIDVALATAGVDVPTINVDQWRFTVVYGLLWPRGAQIRQSGLSLYSPFADLPAPEPLLLQQHLAEARDLVDLQDADWRERCLHRLGEAGAVVLVCPMAALERLSDAFAFLATNPVQTDYLSVFARVQAVRRVMGVLHIDVDVAEALQ